MMNESHHAASAVLVLGIVFGLIMIVLTPPFQVPDEEAHFYRAYQTSIFDLSLEKRGGRVGADLPRSLRDTWLLFKLIRADSEKKVRAAMYAHALEMTDTEPVFCSPILPYPPAGYIAQSAGMLFGRMAGAPPIVSLYLARILNLALFLLLATWAVRCTPAMKWGFVLLLLMPMTLFEAASLSADAFTAGIAYLLIAFILRCAADEGRLTFRELIFLFSAAVLLALAKQGYWPIVLLVLLIPARRFCTPWRKFFTLAALILLTAGIGIAYAIAAQEYSTGVAGSNIADQMRYIVSHPFSYLATLLRSPFRLFYLESFIGRLGWLETRLSPWILAPYGLMLAAIPFLERQRFVLSAVQRFWTGILGVSMGALIFTIQYLSWTPVGKAYIAGVQGRYFIPIALLLFLPFCGRRIFFSIEENALARRITVGILLFVHIATAATLMLRYYPIG
jgi:uncharacterized membrane protein